MQGDDTNGTESNIKNCNPPLSGDKSVQRVCVLAVLTHCSETCRLDRHAEKAWMCAERDKGWVQHRVREKGLVREKETLGIL